MNWQNLIEHDERSTRLKACILPTLESFLLADYQAMELRVGAAYMALQPTLKDYTLAKEFLAGIDSHKKTAQLVYGRKDVTPAERQRGKRVMFSMFYAGGPNTIYEQGICDTRSEAIEFVNAFHEARPMIRNLERCVQRLIKERGWVKTVWGRKLWVEPRLGVNSLIQGSSSDIMKDAIIRTAKYCRLKFDPSHFTLTIHDSLMIDTYNQHLPVIAKALPKLMGNSFIEKVLPLDVELKVAQGPWSTATELTPQLLKHIRDGNDLPWESV